jgi:hypothetical protein
MVNIKECIVIISISISGFVFGMGKSDQNILELKNIYGTSLPIVIPNANKRRSSLSRSDSNISPQGTPASAAEMIHIQQAVNRNQGSLSFFTSRVVNLGVSALHLAASTVGAVQKASDPEYRALLLGQPSQNRVADEQYKLQLDSAIDRNNEIYQHILRLIANPFITFDPDFIGALANRARLTDLCYFDQRGNKNIAQQSAYELAKDMETTARLLHDHYQAFLLPLLLMVTEQRARQASYAQKQNVAVFNAQTTQMAVVHNLLEQLTNAMATINSENFLQASLEKVEKPETEKQNNEIEDKNKK